jgi:xanthine dehydrogenase YagT iron-sulfur-binding subunit
MAFDARMNRRDFVTVAATSAALPFAAHAANGSSAAKAGADQPLRQFTLNVNGQNHLVSLDPRTSLLDAIRDHIGLTGTKKGCDHGQCGACTVHINGRRALSCMKFAVAAEGDQITTIEGLGTTQGALHPMQQAFIDHDAFQCGYCTPGQIMSAIACVNEGHANRPEDIREYMSGNLCRCAAYPNIVAAVEQGRDRMRQS